MAKYKERWESPIDNTLVGYLDTESGANIPLDAGNVNYQEVLAWIAESNTPDPAFTQAEIDAYTAAQTEEATRITEADAEIKLGVLANKTYDQVDTYVDTNITDMASAKLVIQKMARIILAIIKKANFDL